MTKERQVEMRTMGEKGEVEGEYGMGGEKVKGWWKEEWGGRGRGGGAGRSTVGGGRDHDKIY